MAKRAGNNPIRKPKSTATKRPRTVARRSAKRPIKKAQSNRRAASPRKSSGSSNGRKPVAGKGRKPLAGPAKARKAVALRKSARPKKPAAVRLVTARKTPRLDRVRRTLDETVPSPPSSLDMDRHGSAARTGRAEFAESLALHRGMADVTGGDVDVNIESAYFSGDEAPGGDNPTPDQDVVEEIGKALGVHYEDHEELKGADKIADRDKHRWEMDPASSEDYKDRK